MQICIKCKTEKTLDSFRFRKDRNKHVTICKPCVNIRQKLHRDANIFSYREKEALYKKENKQKIKEGNRLLNIKNREENQKYYQKHKERFKDGYLRREYKITLDEYNTIYSRQGGKCKICNKHQSELKIALCVDHNHKNGDVRGLLCSACNKALGLLQDDYNIVIAAGLYLQSHTFSVSKKE